MRHPRRRLSARFARWSVVVASAALLATPAHAGEEAPWAPAVDKLMGWLQGPTAIGIITIAVLVAGYALLFKGEQGAGFRKAGFVAIGIALIISAGKLVAEMYTGGGATLP